MLKAWLARVIRHVQTTRKEAGMEIADRIFPFPRQRGFGLPRQSKSIGKHQQRDAGNSSGRKSVDDGAYKKRAMVAGKALMVD